MSGPSNPAPRHAIESATGELIGVLPFFLGYRPTNSLILIAGEQALGPTVRVDLPAPAQTPAVVQYLRQYVAAAHAVSVTVIVVDHQGSEEVLPHRTLVDALNAELLQVSVTLHAVWAHSADPGSRYRSYGSCGCVGSVPPVETSPAATAMIVAGATVVNSRDDVAATLRHDPPVQLNRRAAILRARRCGATGPPPTAESGYQLLRDTIAAVVDSPALPVLDDTHIVELAAALTDPAVRGRCMALIAAADAHADIESDSHDGQDVHTGRQADPVSVDPLADPLFTHPGLANAAERVWTLLTRAVPGPERAEPAVFLTIQAYLRGNSTLASIAIGIALDANAHHPLAPMLGLAVRHGMAPETIRQLLRQSIQSATEWS